MPEEVYSQIIRQLASEGFASPRLEARLLIAAAAGINSNEVSSQTKLTQDQQSKLDLMLKKRLNHTPLDKILGKKEFYKHTFITNEHVLSPRPDTEILLESALELIQKHPINHIADFGTGSGCLLLSILSEFENLHGIGIDISAQALETAKSNALNLGLDKRACFWHADWNDPNFTQHVQAPFELIVSNPPYIPSKDIDFLEPEVRDHDPKIALDGGYDGLSAYRQLARLCQKVLKPKGYILLEIGIDQAQDVIKIFQEQGLVHLSTKKDLSGIERCVVFEKKLAI